MPMNAEQLKALLTLNDATQRMADLLATIANAQNLIADEESAQQDTSLAFPDREENARRLQQETETKPTAPPGSVIHGTLRNEDLIPAFLRALNEYAPYTYHALVTESWPRLFDQDENLIPENWMRPDGQGDDWWVDNEDSALLLDELFEELSACAPEGYYFGAHYGDGSDFGFWPIEDHSRG